MLAPWLLYSSFLGILLSAVALLAERILRWRGKAARWVWLAAIITMVAAPALLSIRPRAPIPVSVLARPSAAHRSSSVATSEPVTATLNLDKLLFALWLAASTLLLLRVLGGAIVLHHRRRRWVPAQLGGQPVLLADELGPAVIGWRRFTTVIPRWALTFDERSRELMLAHETEHASSGDPYLRSIALAALVLMPWNPALWFAMRRLRLAVEMDCDQRVLSGGADPQQYSALLLAVGERMSATPFAWATALGGTRSLLEKRVRGMIAPWLPRYPRIAIGALSVVIGLIAFVACSAPVPDPVVIAASRAADTLTVDCKAGTVCADSGVWKLVNWVVRVRNPQDTIFRQLETIRRNCLPSDTVCGSLVDEQGNETLFGIDTLFVDSRSGKIWTSVRIPDEREVGSPQPDGRGEFAASGAHFCNSGDACDSRMMIFKALSGVTPRAASTDYEVVRSNCPVSKPVAGYWPRCND